jgi:hypothetical protein
VKESVLIWRAGQRDNFFRRWHRVIAFLGATIVLTTFLVKDEKRDSIKDEIGKIQNVQSTYLIRESASDALVRMSVIENMLRGAYPAAAKTHDEETRAAIEKWIYELKWIWDRVEPKTNDADNLRRFAASLSDLPKELKDNADALQDDVKAIEKRINADALWRNNEHTAQDYLDEADKISELNSQLETKMDQTKEGLKDYADSVIEIREHQLLWWTWGSNVLFVLGWVIGLTGKMYGFEA